MTEFHVSPEHIRRKKRQAFCLIVCLGFAVFVFLEKALNASKITDLGAPIIVTLGLVAMMFNIIKNIKEGKASYPTLEPDEANRKVAVGYKDLQVIVDFSHIKNLRLQRKSGKLVSILVKTASGEALRFEGYENLDVLASALERITPPENITQASFFHR